MFCYYASMLIFYSSLTAFAPEVLGPAYCKKAEEYTQYAETHYYGSPFFRSLMARNQRQQRKLDEAIKNFEIIAKVPQDDDPNHKITPLSRAAWGAQHHLCVYELAMTELYRFNFAQAAKYYEELAEARYWSPITCRYLQAACLDALGDTDAANEAYRKILEIPVHKRAGRMLSSEDYVYRKLKIMKEQQQSGIKVSQTVDMICLFRSPIFTHENVA
jgi:tetratricopeptide (TPR) repeat protein